MSRVLVAGRARLLSLVHALAEQVERGGDAARVEGADRRERLAERLAGDEARRHTPGEALRRTNVKTLLLVREVEQRLPQHAPSLGVNAKTSERQI